MTLDFRNTNTLWGSILVETLFGLGLKQAIICPGSRSTPLAIAFAQHPQIEAIPILDERSAAFFGLGLAKQSSLPVALVCTSGTAGANFFPAVIEARESRIPLLILTGDRPPELRECHSGQTIDQIKLYGTYPNWYFELSLPSPHPRQLAYLRQTLIHAWERALYPTPGVVHLNLPFCDPLAPLPDGENLPHGLDDLFSKISPFLPPPSPNLPIPAEWVSAEKGLIIAGVAAPQAVEDYVSAIAILAKTLKFPVLAEGLSPLRNYAQFNPYLISTYDLILRNPQIAQFLTPELVIQIGDFPTSKILRQWLTEINPQNWVIDPSHHNLDPLHLKTSFLRTRVETLTLPQLNKPVTSYLQTWLNLEQQTRQILDSQFTSMTPLFEGKTAWLLSQILPPQTPLMIANSMPVRDVEYFWKPNSLQIQPFFNRGANGIDGTLSTALGMAHQNQPSVLLTGDLALLHDTNGLLIRNQFKGHLTILLINNHGGGIFEMLPIAQFDPPFTEFFAMPQDINFAQLCTTYGVEYHQIESWDNLQEQLNPLPTTGMRVLELKCDRKQDAQWRKQHLPQFIPSNY